MGKAKDGGGSDEPPPLRLWYPLNYALQTWADWTKHGLLPKPGGYDAQDAAWTADMQTITRRYNWHMRQLTAEDGGGDTLRDMDDDDLIPHAGRVDWHGLIGE